MTAREEALQRFGLKKLMANLFFPQLATGALAQYPIKRKKSLSTVTSRTEDGTVYTYFDPKGSMLTWELAYADITQTEADQLLALFDVCAGRLRAFTFIDPVANLLMPQWQVAAGIEAVNNVYTNKGTVAAEVSQSFSIPSGYAYSFSLPGDPNAAPDATVTLIRRGTSTEQRTVVGLNRPQLYSSGALADSGAQFTAAVELRPGQTVDLSRAQLEAQPFPSSFRMPQGGVYNNAHWAVDELLFTTTGPDLFSTKFSIETNV